MKRTVIKIDERLCNGCGNCINGCHEGALQLIDGKAVMISDLYCDGLGACIGECPLGAIAFERREAEPYDETVVMARLLPKGEAAIIAHLKHLYNHGEYKWVKQGLAYLKQRDIPFDPAKIGMSPPTEQCSAIHSSRPQAPELKISPLASSCPDAAAREIKRPQAGVGMAPEGSENACNPDFQSSELRQFPVQLHLLNPQAEFLREADLLLAADCTAFASGVFHSRFLRGKSLAIACPKLDLHTQHYVDKLARMIGEVRIRTLTVLVMEVPCCQGLVKLTRQAREQAGLHVPIRTVVLSIGGDVVVDQWF